MKENIISLLIALSIIIGVVSVISLICNCITRKNIFIKIIVLCLMATTVVAFTTMIVVIMP